MDDARRTLTEARDLLTRLSLSVDDLHQELAVVLRRLQLLEAAAGLQVRTRDRGALKAKVLELRAEGLSTSRIATTLGVGRTSVYRLLADAPDAPAPEYVVGTSGKRYPTTIGRENGRRLNELR